MDLYNWRKKIEDGQTSSSRKNMAIVLIDEQGNEKSRWEFSNAWPTKYDAVDFNATANEIAIETMEIAHENMKRTK
jgi:phage tail-like protein